MQISSEDLERIKKYEQALNRGFIVQGAEVTATYNRVFETYLAPTSCSSCVRQRVSKLVEAKKQFEAEMAKIEEAKKVEETPQEEPQEKPKKTRKKKSE